MSDCMFALLIIDEILQQEEEESEHINLCRRRKRSKQRLINNIRFSNDSILKALKESEQKDSQNYLRMSDDIFKQLLSKVQMHIEKKNTLMREAISAQNRLAITLRYLITGASFENLRLSTTVSAQAIGKIVIETCKAIIRVLKHLIKLPATATEWLHVAQQFYDKSRFPNCLGVLDGKHINITKPPEAAPFYVNHKRAFSIVLLAIVDSNADFLMVEVGTKGRASDSSILAQTKFFEKLENAELNLPAAQPVLAGHAPLPCVFVSDDAFALRKNILKTFSQPQLSSQHKLYNKTLCSARQPAEQAFRLLASRFRILKTTINLNPEKATTVVLACCYLHNYLNSQSTLADSSEPIVELLGIQPTVQKNAPTEAKAVRQQFCEALTQLQSA